MRSLLVLLLSLALHDVGSAQQTDQTPRFRAGIELVRIPVRVLDNKGRFVGDLTRDEFRLFEDGVAQDIATFDLIQSNQANSAAIQPTTKSTESAVAPSESSPSVRTYVVLIDDYHLLPDEAAKATSIAKTFLREHTTNGDRVAIVFASGERGQDLTSDRSLLLSTVDRLRGQFDPRESAGIIEMKARGIVTAVGDIARNLSGQSAALRRAILVLSPGFGCTPSAAPGRVPWCGTGWLDTLRAAAASSVTVYAVDPRGSRNPAWKGASAESPSTGTSALFQSRNGVAGPGANVFDAAHVLANDTGGFSLTGSENFKNAFDRITLEMSQYYLLGYYPARSGAGDDAIHQNEIRVSRFATKVFYRRTYLGSRPAETSK